MFENSFVRKFREVLKKDKRVISIPNVISFFRLLLLAPLLILFSHINDGYEFRVYILLLLGLIGLSDMLDGYLARKLHQVTELGKILDPISDKVIIGAVAIFMFLSGEIPASYFALVIARDI